jgi:hypothetical protein
MRPLILIGIAIGLAIVYLSVAATICVALDRSLSPRIKAFRILIAWLVPILGAVVTIWVALDGSQTALRRRWWLWPIWPLLPNTVPETGFSAVVDMAADANRILPGSTLPPPL